MPWLGGIIAASLKGFSWPVLYLILIVAYVLIHYFFVSQTAQMLALSGMFLSVGWAAGVPGSLMALMLLFATNFFAAITPQGSSANVIFTASGYLQMPEVYRYGAVVTLSNTIIYLVFGTAWISLLGIQFTIQPLVTDQQKTGEVQSCYFKHSEVQEFGNMDPVSCPPINFLQTYRCKRD